MSETKNAAPDTGRRDFIRKRAKAFPAKTVGKGNQLLQPRIEKGVKVYDLTCEEIEWEVEPGRKTKAWAYNGQVPGPPDPGA